MKPDLFHHSNDLELLARKMSDADDGTLLLAGIGPISWEQLTDEDREGYLKYARIARDHYCGAPEEST